MRAKLEPLAQPYPKREKQANVGTTDTAAEHHRPSRSNPTSQELVDHAS